MIQRGYGRGELLRLPVDRKGRPYITHHATPT